MYKWVSNLLPIQVIFSFVKLRYWSLQVKVGMESQNSLNYKYAKIIGRITWSYSFPSFLTLALLWKNSNNNNEIHNINNTCCYKCRIWSPESKASSFYIHCSFINVFIRITSFLFTLQYPSIDSRRLLTMSLFIKRQQINFPCHLWWKSIYTEKKKRKKYLTISSYRTM